MPYQKEKPDRYGGAVRTKGGSLLVFEVDRDGTTIKLNSSEIAQVYNPDMALVMNHVIEQIRLIIAQREDILAVDKRFLTVDDEAEEDDTRE